MTISTNDQQWHTSDRVLQSETLCNPQIDLKAINQQIVQLQQLFDATKSGINVGNSHCAEQLIATLRTQPNHLVAPWRMMYITVARLLLGFMYYEARYQEAVTAGERLLAELKTDDSLVFTIFLNNISVNYVRLGRYQEGLDHLFHAHSLMISYHNDTKESYLTIANIGSLYGLMNEPEKAIGWHQKSFAFAKKHQMLREMQLATSNLCETYGQLGNYEQAVQYGGQSIELLEKHNQAGNGRIYNRIADAWFALSNMEKADAYHRQGLTYNREKGNKLGILTALRGLGNLTLKQGSLVESLTLLEEALLIAEEMGSDSEIHMICELLSEAHNQLGNDKEALRYHKRFYAAYTAVYDQQKQESLHQLEVKHRTEISQVELRSALEREGLLKTANTQLQEAYDELSALLKIITHDLFNPLQAIMLRVNHLDKLIHQQKVEKGLDALRKLNRSADFMKGLIGQVQRMSMVDAGQIELTWGAVLLESVLPGVIEQNRVIAIGKKITLHAEMVNEVVVVSDRVTLQRIFDNLLSNTIKYSPEGSTVTVRMRRLENQVCIDFIDQGVGIAADEIDRLFTRFGKLPSSRPTAKEHSTGLGLYITKKLVEVIGGQISVRSDGLGLGAIFTVCLPMNVEDSI